jgi:Holliday junction DNA helicase RuvA
MIAHISGKLIHKSPEYVVVDVGGVGYRLFTPLSTYYRLPQAGENVQLHTYTHVREDTLQLYGFWSLAEKELFEQLIGVSKIGPRLARNILSGLPAEQLRQAICTSDVAAITTIPGVGRKVAERVVMELRDKLAETAGEAERVLIEEETQHKDKIKDAVSALVNLGYKPEAARAAVRKSLRELGAAEELEGLIKHSLGLLARH